MRCSSYRTAVKASPEASVSPIPKGKAETEGGERSRPGDLSVFIGAGAVAGFSPEEVRRMTLAEWHVVIESFIAANSPPDEGSTEDEFIAVLAEEMAAGRA